MYYENKREKQRKNFFVFLCMVIIIGLLFALNMRLEWIGKNGANGEYSAERLSLEENKVDENEVNKSASKNYDFIEKCSKAIVGISKLKDKRSINFFK